MKYHRPETIEEAVKLLAEGVPLAGGTALAPHRRRLEAVIDLGKLGLDQIEITQDRIELGTATKLQSLVARRGELPGELIRCCRLEAAWNLRNMATVGGTIMSAGSRSPMLVVLLALKSTVSIQGVDAEVALDEVLDRREKEGEPFLIEQITFSKPAKLSYDYVARAPTDRPIVSAAAASAAGETDVSVAIGGFGTRPLLLEAGSERSPEEWGRLAAEQYADAADPFASAGYRSEVAAILVERVVKEVRA
jgi:CO/xanthine dehydrogenase FAD-binding subunit